MEYGKMKKENSDYMRRLFDFLSRLAQNNNREWFHQNKDEFDELRLLWQHDVQRLIDTMAEYDNTLNGVDVKDCVYRIYRDIRFSPNKLPYKIYFGAVIAQGGRKTPKGCYYLHIQPGASGLHGGIWCPEMPLLTQLRHEIEDNIDEFVSILNDKNFCSRYSLTGESLKTMPKGFDRNSPYGKYIKMKEFLASMPVADNYFYSEDWVSQAAADFKHLKPFNDFLNYVFEM